MRDDQVQRLSDLSDELIDVVLEEADPKEWPGAGKPLGALEQQERGDRYWCKKNAAATLSLAAKVQSMLDQRLRPDWKPAQEDDADLDKQISAAEKEAARRIEAIQSGRRSTRMH